MFTDEIVICMSSGKGKKKLMRNGQLILKNILKYETDKLKTKLTYSSA